MKEYIMVKKRKANGEPCRKCLQVEDQLKERGFWNRIDRVIWAEENNPQSEGRVLARKYGVDIAPFFIVYENNTEKIYKSSLQFIKKELENSPPIKTSPSHPSLPDLITELKDKSPGFIIRKALELYGKECVISFSGAEDVALIEMAVQTGMPFSVFSLDTGRLHEETYRFLQKVRDHYGIRIRIISPEREELEPFVEEKGLTSFYLDGHRECCMVRKVQPLKRVLGDYKAWITGQRKDQNPATRGELDVIQKDSFSGKTGEALIKFNPLSDWSQKQVWEFIRSNNVPYNELHDRGYISIGCEPCTRPQQPGEHERASRWWWEEDTKRECGLHS
jgi:phosphoadenosine phosphosulfate reductase